MNAQARNAGRGLVVRRATRVRPQPFAIEQMSPALDQLSLKFAIEARAVDGMVLDIGCGDGLASVAALERGGRVVAVDPDESRLQRLLASVPQQQHPRIKLRVGRLPDIDFKVAHFSAVHVARVLHLLDGAAIQSSLRKFYRWLYPDGRLFISALTPKGAAWKPLYAECRRRHAARARWPGYIEDLSLYYAPRAGGATALHLLDERVLRRELRAAGFTIEEASCYPLPWDPDQMCCAMVATCASLPLSKQG